MNPIEQEIRNHPFLLGLKPAHMSTLCTAAARASFKAGDIILKEREPAFHAYLLLSGSVAVEAHSRSTQRNVPVDRLGGGDVLGWSWLFAPYCWHFQARAVSDVEAIALDGSNLLVRCEEDHELGYALMKRMTQLLIRRLEATRRTIIALDHRVVETAAHDQPA